MRGRNQLMWQSSFPRASRSWRYWVQSTLWNASAAAGAASAATSPRVCTLAIALCKAAAATQHRRSMHSLCCLLLSRCDAGSFVCMCDVPLRMWLSADLRSVKLRPQMQCGWLGASRGGKQVEWEGKGRVATEAVAARVWIVCRPQASRGRNRHDTSRRPCICASRAHADADAVADSDVYADAMRCDGTHSTYTSSSKAPRSVVPRCNFILTPQADYINCASADSITQPSFN